MKIVCELICHSFIYGVGGQFSQGLFIGSVTWNIVLYSHCITLLIIKAPVLFFRHYFGDDMTTDSLVNGFPPPPLPEDEEQPELLQVKKIFFHTVGSNYYRVRNSRSRYRTFTGRIIFKLIYFW